jgi:hypothetical protein
MVKIPEKIIDRLCQKILDHLKEKKLVQLKAPENKIRTRMVQAFQEDLAKETKLDAEVRQMLEKYRQAIDRGEIDEHKMFQMIRKQLIKERKLVI